MTDKQHGNTVDSFHPPPVSAGVPGSGRQQPRHDLFMLTWWGLAAASLAVLAVFFALGQYAYPSSDDFCMVVNARDYGLFSYLWQHYFDWSGRYSGNALYGLYPSAFGLFAGYPWLAGLLITLVVVAAAWLLATLSHLSLRHPAPWLLALVFACVYLLGLRHTASSLYWLAGAMTYQGAHILLLLAMTLMLKLLDQQRRQVSVAAVLSMLLLVIVLGVGTNEINMILLTLLVMMTYLFHRLFKPELRGLWWLLLLVTLACALVVYLSPGNSAREATFPLRHDLARSIDGSLRMGSWTLMVWTGNPVFIAATLLAVFASAWLRQLSVRTARPGDALLLLFALLTFSMPFLLQFPAWWAMGGWPPPRTVDAIFFVFLLCWLGWVAAMTLRFLPASLLYADDGAMKPRARGVFLLAATLFVASVAINGKLQRALDDLFEFGPAFHQYMMQRHQLIAQAVEDGRYSLQVPAYGGELPRSIYFNDIRPDWRDWRNACYARYFGLRAIQRDPGADTESRRQQTQDARF